MKSKTSDIRKELSEVEEKMFIKIQNFFLGEFLARKYMNRVIVDNTITKNIHLSYKI